MGGIADFFYNIGRGGKQIRADYRGQLDLQQAQTDYQTGRAQEALAKAAIAADQRLQREKLAAATRDAYGAGNENLADFTSTSALSGVGNIDQSTGAAQKVSEIIMQLAAKAAAEKGNYREQNANLAAVSGKPVEHVKEVNGERFDPYDPGVKPELTSPGAAMVADRRASAGSHDATAEAARARADLYRKGGNARASGSSAKGDPPELKWAREQINNGEDPKRIADYLVKKGFPKLAKQVYSPTETDATDTAVEP
jgi:hypothetical protein